MTADVRLLDRRTRGEIVRMEGHARRSEEREFAGRVRVLGQRIGYAVRTEQLITVEQSAGELIHLADRRLRQIGPDDGGRAA